MAAACAWSGDPAWRARLERAGAALGVRLDRRRRQPVALTGPYRRAAVTGALAALDRAGLEPAPRWRKALLTSFTPPRCMVGGPPPSGVWCHEAALGVLPRRDDAARPGQLTWHLGCSAAARADPAGWAASRPQRVRRLAERRSAGWCDARSWDPPRPAPAGRLLATARVVRVLALHSCRASGRAGGR